MIVNDMGSINVDAEILKKNGSNVTECPMFELQNGCICCTLKMDLIQQLHDIIVMQKFDYIVIEASGICEPDDVAELNLLNDKAFQVVFSQILLHQVVATAKLTLHT